MGELDILDGYESGQMK